jgi:hypothetical protein
MVQVNGSAAYGTAPTSGKECVETYFAMDVKASISGSHYSGHQPEVLVIQEIVANDEHRDVEPKVRSGNERCCPRIPCRNVQACVRTQFASIVVSVTNISRKGLCFGSTERFFPGTAVSVATYYVEGGQNIFQNGRIVRVRYSIYGTFNEYGVEF